MLCKHSTTACIASSVHVQAARRTFGSKVACFSHGTVAPVSSFSSSNVVLQSSGSHVLRPRVAQVSARLNIQHCSCKKLF
jgi:hypothetical protein